MTRPATGRAFAEQGARVILAARRADALEELARQCQAAGAQALAVATDVTDEAAVAELARRAVERLGHIDVWVNNASGCPRPSARSSLTSWTGTSAPRPGADRGCATRSGQA